MRRKNGKGPPLCGDRLVDWIFKRFIEILNYEVLAIKKKKRLSNPDDPHHQALMGLLTEENEIYLSASKAQHQNKDEMLETLIHEISHILCREVREKYIEQLEGILWIKFTDEQKKIIKKFIPKHQVKKVKTAPAQ